MGWLFERRRLAKKEAVRQDLSQHLFNVSAAEQRSPTHRKLPKRATRKEAAEYLEYRMELRKKWIENFFDFRPEIDPSIRKELTEEAYEDVEILKTNIMAAYK